MVRDVLKKKHPFQVLRVQVWDSGGTFMCDPQNLQRFVLRDLWLDHISGVQDPSLSTSWTVWGPKIDHPG